MQYINSHLGIPVLPKFKDMMSVSGYSNASGDSASSLESKIASIEQQLSSLDVKRQKEELKLANEQDKKKRAAAKMTIVGGYKFREGERELRQANVAINQAKTEIRNIDEKIKSLSIDLADYQNRLKSVGVAVSTASAPTKASTPSVPPVAGGSASAGLAPLPDENTTPPSTTSAGSAKKSNWPLYVGLGLVGYFALAYYMGKVVKPQ